MSALDQQRRSPGRLRGLRPEQQAVARSSPIRWPKRETLELVRAYYPHHRPAACASRVFELTKVLAKANVKS